MRSGLHQKLSRVYSVQAPENEPQRRDERRGKSEGRGGQNNHLLMMDIRVTGTGLSLRPSQCKRLETRILDKVFSPLVFLCVYRVSAVFGALRLGCGCAAPSLCGSTGLPLTAYVRLGWNLGLSAALASACLLNAAAQTPGVTPPGSATNSTHLLLIDRFGNTSTASTNEVSPSLYPSAPTGLRNQIPHTPAGTPQPEAFRQRIIESKTGRAWFPPTPPVLMPYLAGPDEQGNTDFQPGALLSNDPLSRYPQALKYWLSDLGIRYSFHQCLTMLSMTDTATGSSALEYYSAGLSGKWAISEAPSDGRASWLSYQADIQLGLSPSSRSQLPQSNLGVIASPNANIYGPNGIWIQELAWQQSLLDGKLVFLAGQVNQGNYLDGNTYAGNSYGQFLNFAFCKDAVLPLPYNNLGLNLQYQPNADWYVMFGTGALNQGAGQSPFDNVGLQNWSYLFEFGLTPSDVFGLGPGAYRLQPFLATVDGLTQAG